MSIRKMTPIEAIKEFVQKLTANRQKRKKTVFREAMQPEVVANRFPHHESGQDAGQDPERSLEVNLGEEPAQDRLAYSFQDEVFFSMQHQRNKWALVACIAMGLSVLCVLSIIFMLPLKEKQPYVVMVDKTTGQAEKIVQVRPVTLTEQEAVLQAEVVSYIVDRETYDMSDNASRIPSVLERSNGQAQESLKKLWKEDHEQYPPEVYGNDSRVTVKIKSISQLPQGNVVRAHFNKTRESHGMKDVTRDFVATIGYDFTPRSERRLDKVWENPLGFSVNSYRVDATR